MFHAVNGLLTRIVAHGNNRTRNGLGLPNKQGSGNLGSEIFLEREIQCGRGLVFLDFKDRPELGISNRLGA